jgi:hypothetical protein
MLIGTVEPSLFIAIMTRVTVLLVGVGLVSEVAKADRSPEARLPIPKPIPFFGE